MPTPFAPLRFEISLLAAAWLFIGCSALVPADADVSATSSSKGEISKKNFDQLGFQLCLELEPYDQNKDSFEGGYTRYANINDARPTGAFTCSPGGRSTVVAKALQLETAALKQHPLVAELTEPASGLRLAWIRGKSSAITSRTAPVMDSGATVDFSAGPLTLRGDEPEHAWGFLTVLPSSSPHDAAFGTPETFTIELSPAGSEDRSNPPPSASPPAPSGQAPAEETPPRGSVTIQTRPPDPTSAWGEPARVRPGQIPPSSQLP